MTAFRDVARKIWRTARRMADPPLHRPDIRTDFKVLGTDYGGWPAILDRLSPDALVYSFGVGTDISFDRELIARTGCAIEAFDPTPRCLEWVEAQTLPERFRFHPVGLSDKSETLIFSSPERQDHVSYTVGTRTEQTETVALPVKALSEIMDDLGHAGRHLDFLKMDIEGSEYAAIRQMMETGIRPEQLCVEYHHAMFGYSKSDTRESVALLRNNGYGIHYVSDGGREYGFLRD